MLENEIRTEVALQHPEDNTYYIVHIGSNKKEKRCTLQRKGL